MPRSASRHASWAYEFGLMPMTELPLRSVGPEPAMITATGTGPRTLRGTVSVPASPRPGRWIVYGVSIAAAGGTVSARAAAWPCSAGARNTRTSNVGSRLVMLFPPPQHVGLHHRNSDREGGGRAEHHPHQRPRDQHGRDHHQPRDHERESAR